MPTTVATPTDIEHLSERLDALEKRVAALETAEPQDPPSDPPPDNPPPDNGGGDTDPVDPPPATNDDPAPLAASPTTYYLSNGAQLYIAPKYDPATRTVKTVVSYAEYCPIKDFNLSGVRYLLDGLRMTGVVDPRAATPLTIASGVHALEVEVVDGAMDLTIVRPETTIVAVSNDDTQVYLPSEGGTHHTRRWSGSFDLVKKPVGLTRALHQPIPHDEIFVPPVRDLTGEDPATYRHISKWWREPLQHFNSNLYETMQAYARNGAGVVFPKPLHYQSGDNATDATPLVRRHPQYDGPRLTNSLTPYVTLSPMWSDKDKLVGVTLDGRIVYVDNKTGKVDTIAGRKRKDNTQIALDWNDSTIPAQAFDDDHEWLGEFPEGVKGLNAPHDIIELRNKPGVFVIVDSFNHRLLVLDTNVEPLRFVTVCGVADVLGDTEGPALQALLDKPYSVEELDNGDLVIACTARDDGTNSAIKLLSGDWINGNGTVRNIVSTGPKGADTGVWRPFVGRLDSKGRLVVVEYDTALLKRIDLDTGAVTVLARNVTRARWYWLAVDRWGSIGPVDDMIVTASTGHNNTSAQRYDGDGNFLNIWEGFAGTTNNYLAQGPASECFQAADHYPWAVCISPHEARAWFYGFGGIGVRSVRRKLPTDPVVRSDYGVYGIYRSMIFGGSLPGMPYGVRPSFTALRSLYGHTELDLPTYDELIAQGMTDAQLADYVRSGFGGKVERPEIFGYWADVMVYGIRVTAYPLSATPALPPKKPSATPPEIRAVRAAQNMDGSWTVAFRTTAQAATAITFGKAAGKYHRASFVGVGTEHSVTLRDKPEHFVIDAWDGAGNRIQTLDLVS